MPDINLDAELHPIVTLLVEEGNKGPGSPIATHCPSRRERYLVFMPSRAPVGQKVRVRLTEVGKTDTRGSKLYRGEAAPAVYEDRWKDNGDGTASRVTVSIDWLLHEKEEGECERKTLGKDSPRPDRAIRANRYTIDLSTSLAMATVLEETVVTTPLVSERVDNTVQGGLIWAETGKSEIVEKSDIFAVSRVCDTNRQLRLDQLVQVGWDAEWPMSLAIYFTKAGSETNVNESAKWSKLPAWVQTVVQACWPVCSCRRERVVLAQGHKTDEYPKCSKCRSEAHCDRCSKAGSTEKLSFLSGRLVCQSCLPYEKAEQHINQHCTQAHKAKVIADAEILLLGQVMPAELGFLVLKSGLGHVAEGWNKEQILSRWKGYQWYYLTDEGIYGSKFSPATLQIFQFVSQATGNGLVEMMAWLSGGQKVDLDRDFFIKTQVKGENATLPQVEDIVQKLVGGSNALGDRLRDSEKSRLEMLDAVKSIESLRGEGFRSSLFLEIQNLMEGDAQEYGSVIQKVAELKALTPPPPPSPTRSERRRRSRSNSADWNAVQQNSAGQGGFTIGEMFPDIKVKE